MEGTGVDHGNPMAQALADVTSASGPLSVPSGTAITKKKRDRVAEELARSTGTGAATPDEPKKQK
eukprot:1360702-Pyramimonas_sp.AAC.1